MKGDNTFITTMQRHKNGLIIPNGTLGTLSTDGQYYLWRINYSGFQILFHEIESLLNQIVHGARNISGDTLKNVIGSLELMESFLKNIPEKINPSDKLSLIKKSCLILINKFVHIPNPPMQLLAVCLRYGFK